MTLTRRRFLTDSCLVAAGVHPLGVFGQSSRRPATVQTPSGPLTGQPLQGATVFRGIPFAQPPIGPLRFRAPRSLSPRKATQDATRFGPAATQPGLASSGEDCLYLNLWAPEGLGPFPVYVWVHGGGFTAGTSFAPLFDGTQLAHEGVLTVTVAYRLGVFGFLDVSPLLGPEYAGSANNGLRDVIAALQWVHTNIAAFGGDPGRVTIGGESAGAKITDTLMGVPSASSLFHQVISESGGAERVWDAPQNRAAATAFREHWQAQATSTDLSTAPASSLIEAQGSFIAKWPGHFPLRPSIDHDLLAQLPIQTIREGSTRGKRLLLGTNRDESALFVGPNPPAAASTDLTTVPLERFGPLAARYAQLYPNLSEAQRRIRALTAEEYWVPSLRVADAHLAGGGSAWVYRLDFAESSGKLKGFSYHSLDLPLVWDHPNTTVENAPLEAGLAKQMHRAWLTFLRGEAPSAPGLPEWSTYNSLKRPTLALNVPSRLEIDPQSAELALWNSLF